MLKNLIYSGVLFGKLVCLNNKTTWNKDFRLVRHPSDV